MDTDNAKQKARIESKVSRDDVLQDQVELSVHGAAFEVDDVATEERLCPERKRILRTSCPLILGNELCERLAYYGLATNMVLYLTDVLGMSNADATAQLSIWSGTCYVTPLIGAFLADSYLGRYWVIIMFSITYLVGLILLTCSAAVPSLKPVAGVPPDSGQLAFFWIAMYFIALGTGGIKPCVSSFGADQFLEDRPYERKLRGSFFNYFYFSINLGSLVASLAIVYVQENVSWAWGFAIPAMAFAVAITLFVSGSRWYRRLPPSGSPFTRIAATIAAAFSKRRLPVPNDPYALNEMPGDESAIKGARKLEHSDFIRCIDHAAIVSDNPKHVKHSHITVSHCEEVKAMINLLPILATSIVWNVVYNQMNTLFVLQGTTMDRSIGSIEIPAASMSFVNTVAVMVCVVMYDQGLLRILKRCDKTITMLQRIGWGYFVAVLSMVVSALIEVWRLQIVAANNLQNVDYDVTPVPMSVWWQVPQYFVIGAAEVFINIGCMELFYASAPDSMRSTASALYLLSNGLSGYITGGLVEAVQAITSGGDPNGGWIGDNLNTSHLDYFFWMLAIMQAVDLVIYIPIAYLFRPPSSAASATIEAVIPSGRKASSFDSDTQVIKNPLSMRPSADASVADGDSMVEVGTRPRHAAASASQV